MKASSLSSQILDASRLFRFHKFTIEKHPLQVYNSVLLFTPTCSRTRYYFRGEEPNFVTMEPAIEDWNPCLQELEGHKAPVTSLKWAPDGTRLTSIGADNVIKIWDLAGSRCVASFKAHNAWIASLSWSKDGTYIASASYDRRVYIWDPINGQCLSTLEHEAQVQCIFWSQDDAQLVSISWEREKSFLTIKVWDRMTGQCVQTLNGNDNMIRSAFPSYDGKQIVSVSCHGVINTWNVFGDQRMSHREFESQKDTLSLWSGDGTSLIQSDWLSDTINIFDISNWKSVGTLRNKNNLHVRRLALSRNGRNLALGSNEGPIEIWDLITRECMTTLKGHSSAVDSMVWLKDGRLASGSYDTTIKVWDPPTSRCLTTLKGSTSQVHSLLVSPDETRLISASEYDPIIKVWGLNPCRALEEHNRSVLRIVWSNDGTYFASYADDTAIKVWNPSTGECVSTLRHDGGKISKLSWSHNGQLASLSSDDTLKIWDVLTGQCSQNIERSDKLSAALAWSQDGSQLMLASYDNFIGRWDARTGQHLSTVKTEKMGLWVEWLHDATCFASVADDWSIVIHNPDTGKCILHLQGHQDPQVDAIPPYLRRSVLMAWSLDGTQLASAMGQTVKIWDAATGKCTLVLELDKDPGSFHFPRGPAFDEPESGYLHTDIGSFNIQSCVDPTTDASVQLVCSPLPVGFGFSGKPGWISHNGLDILPVPRQYREITADAISVSGSTVVIGCATGRVSILKFSKDFFLDSGRSCRSQNIYEM